MIFTHSLFFLLFFLFISLLPSLYSLQTYYISNATNCSFTSCDGSLSKPFAGLIPGFLSAMQLSENSLDFSISFELISNEYVITDQHLSQLVGNPLIPVYNLTYQLFERNISINRTVNYNYLRFKPFSCDNDTTKSCDMKVIISLKTENISFTIANETIYKNLIFYGNDLPYRHQNIINPAMNAGNIDKSCLYDVTMSCCPISQLSNKTNKLCYLIGVDDSQRAFENKQDYQHGLFQHKHDYSVLSIDDCEFNYIIGIGVNSADTFTYLIGAFIDPMIRLSSQNNIQKNLIGLALYVKNTVFEGDYFFFGLIYYTNNNCNFTNISISNTTFDNYNAFLIKDQISYYNEYILIISNSSLINFTNNTINNCFSTMYLDYRNTLIFNNIAIFYDNSRQLQNITYIYKNISIIDGDNENTYNISNIYINVSLIGPFTSFDNHILFQAKNNNTLYMSNQIFNNLTNIAYLNYIYYNKVYMSNVIWQYSSIYAGNLINFNYYNDILLNNCSFQGFQFLLGNYISIQNTSKITIIGLNFENSINIGTGSFISCAVGLCNIMINSSNITNITSYNNPPLIMVLNNNYIYIQSSNFTQLTSNSQGSIVYADHYNTVNFYDCIMNYIVSAEGTIIYIKDYTTFIMNNTNTSNSASSNIAFLYYGRESNNSLYITYSYFENNNGTAIAQLMLGYIYISNCSFSNAQNKLQQALTAYAGSNTYLTFLYNNVSDSFMDTSGWAVIFLQTASMAIITHSNFRNVTAYLASALYASQNSNITIDSIYVDGFILYNEGVIYLESNNIVTINNSIFTNIISYTNGGVLYISSQNILNFTNCVVFNISVTFFGAFAMFSDGNTILIQSSKISMLKAKSKGGFLYAVGGNVVTLQNLYISDILSEGGSFAALSSQNHLIVNNCSVYNMSAIRYGGLIYAFTKNVIELYMSSFELARCEILAGGFYLDIYNNITIDSSIFKNFTAVESGGVFVTIYQNYIYSKNAIFVIISLTESNDGVIANFGLSTNITLLNNSFIGLINQLTSYLFVLNNYNLLNITNNKFLDVNLSSSSGFLQAGSNNIIIFDGSILNFYKNSISTFQGVLFFLLTNNTLQSMTNSTISVSNFLTLFDFEANCKGSIQNLILNSSDFTNFFLINNNSNVKISNMRLKVLHSQQILVSDSQFTLKQISISFQNVTFPSLSFLIITNTQIKIINSYFRVIDKVSTGNFLMASSSSTITLRKTTFIGFSNKGFDIAGVINAMNANSLLMMDCLFLLNEGSDGGTLAYETSIGATYSINGITSIAMRFLADNTSTLTGTAQEVKLHRNIFHCNIADNGRGGGVYINNQDFQDVSMKLSVINTSFVLNKGSIGGGLYASSIKGLEATNNKFMSNKALIQNSTRDPTSLVRAQGGAIYLQGTQWNSTFINLQNEYIENMAEIGGALYVGPLTLIYQDMLCKFDSNGDVYYGVNIASPVYRISFKPLNAITINQTIYQLSLDGIQSGYIYSNCLAEVIGMDKYGNVAIMNNDDFYKQVIFTEKGSNINNPTAIITKMMVDGSICMNSFQKTGLPIKSTSIYEISFQRFDDTTDVLELKISFRDCQIGEKLTQNFQCQTCPDGTYSLAKDFRYIIDNCKACVGLDFSCQPGGLYTPNLGYWRYSNISSNIAQCPKSENCLGGFVILNDSILNNPDYSKIFSKSNQIGDEAISSTGFCKLGYKGVLCNECDDNYGKVNAYTCLQCEASGYVAWVIFQILFKITILFVSLHISLKTSVGLYMEDVSELDIKLTNLIKIMLNHVQMLIVLFTFVDFSQIYNNVISFLLGINSNMGESFNVECLLKQANSTISPLYFEFWITVLYFFPLALVCYFYVRKVHKMWEKQYNKALSFPLLYVSCMLIVLQLCYFDVINVTFKLYPCFNVSDSYNPESRLVFDYSIRCEDANQIIVKYAAGLPIILGFGVGFPFILLMILKKKLGNGTLRTDDSLLTYGYFFFIYEEEFFFWDILQLLRKFSMTLIQILLASRLVVQNFASLEVLLVVVFSFLCLQLKLRPYLKPNFDIVNTLERTSLLALTFTFYFALYHTGLSMAPQSIDMFGSDVALFLLALLINVIFIGYWSYIFLPQQLLSTWTRLKGVGNKALKCFKKKNSLKISLQMELYSGEKDGINQPKSSKDQVSMTVLNWAVRRLCGSIRESQGQPVFELTSRSLLVHLEISTHLSMGPGPKLESVEISKCTSRERGDLFHFVQGALFSHRLST